MLLVLFFLNIIEENNFKNIFITYFTSILLLSVTNKRQGYVSVVVDLNSSGSTVVKKAKQEEEEGGSSSLDNLDSRFRHHNQSILMSVFRDHLIEQEKVIIVCIFPVGVSAVKANSGYV